MIGTVGTVSSGAYVHAVDAAARAAGREIELTSAACPGFVEFVERGQTTGDEVTVLAERLLAPIVAADVDALLLGCTHYPFLARVIGDVVGPDVTLVSSADETAFAALHAARRARPAPRPDARRVGTHRFLSSGDVDTFRELGARLLGPELDAAEPWKPGHAPPRRSRRTTERTLTDDPTRRTRRRRAAPDQLRARLHRDGRRLVPRLVRADPGAVHRQHRRRRAALDARHAARAG